VRIMHVRADLLAKLLSARSPQIQRHRGEVRFTLVCSAEEGVACRFAAGVWNDPLLEPLAEALVSQIGWKWIEHAPVRQVVVRCVVPVGAPERVQCSIDLGSGFEPLPVLADKEA
jgi:hypothetical protein